MEVKAELRGLLQSCEYALTTEVVAHIESLIHAGEPKLALEELCTALDELGHGVPKDQLNRVRTLGKGLGVDASYWEP